MNESSKFANFIMTGDTTRGMHLKALIITNVCNSCSVGARRLCKLG